MRKVTLNILLLLVVIFAHAQKKAIPSDFCITPEEKQVFEWINKIRKENGKKPLKLSKSLSYVAKVHVADLDKNHPDTSICNLSSWSNKGKWTPCCYNPYLPKPLCMKKKPKELTKFPYYGYELASYFEDGLNPDSLMVLWENTEAVKQMILTQNQWKTKKWIIAGVGMNKHYVSVWFAQRPDVVPPPAVCKKNTHQTKTKKNPKKNLKTKNTQPYFYVIHLSFNDLGNAKEALKRTRKNGFKDAGLLVSEGKYRLYLKKFKNSKDAVKFKNHLPKTFSKAWIYKN